MDLDHTSLRLVDPVDGVTLNSQPIHSIRVWGVGRDNGRLVILGQSLLKHSSSHTPLKKCIHFLVNIHI